MGTTPEQQQLLVIVEHADTGACTLHRSDCAHIKRATYVHEATPFWMAAVEHVCHTCHPKDT